ncbi:Lrp/AsnC family transcriptional regulator [Streptomyces sp. MRC013]|nr:Lrp/AsnC family transcriptional regulator [Streptomyces sp. MRC013]URM89259.1 Lrp/AsnC family transcriptional regulator [Streptomyces sp. MRC013]
MADSVITFDRLDRRIVGALQVDGRAEAARIAGVLGVSARTVSRRLARMRDAGAVSVVRLAPPDEVVGATVLRVRVARGRGDTVAEAFAARPDVLSVDLMAGGEEISVLLLGDGAERDRLLYRQVPATAAITSLSVHSVLRVFADARQWRADVLTPEETAGLLAPEPAESAEPPGPWRPRAPRGPCPTPWTAGCSPSWTGTPGSASRSWGAWRGSRRRRSGAGCAGWRPRGDCAPWSGCGPSCSA